MILFNQLKILKDFQSVDYFEELQKLKRKYLHNIEKGNNSNDVCDYPDLGEKYQEVSRQYEKLVFINTSNPNYKEILLQNIEVLKNIAEEETYTLKQTNKGRVDDARKSNSLYMYKTINWHPGETERVYKVARTDVGIVDYPLKRQRDKKGTQERLYLGPMDIAFYPYFSSQYYVKNSLIFAEILAIELLLVERIDIESNYLLNKGLISCLEAGEINLLQEQCHEDYQKRYKKKNKNALNPSLHDSIALLKEAVEIWGNKHRLMYLYYKIIAKNELLEEINEQIKQITKSKKDSTNVNKILRQLWKLDEKVSYQFSEDYDVDWTALDVNSFFNEQFTSLNTKIKTILKEITRFH